MFGLFCRGLHCAGCGKGVPFSLVLVVVGILAINSKSFDSAIGGAAVTAVIYASAMAASAWIMTAIILAVFVRKGPRVGYCRTDRLTYSQMKFLQTGDESWLGLAPKPLLQLEAEDVTGKHRRATEDIRAVGYHGNDLEVFYRRPPER